MGRSIRLPLAGVAVACAIAAAAQAMILAAPAGASARSSAERIVRYDASIAIQRDGSILVTEQITYDFGSDQRHGIFRVIPVRLRYNGSYDRIYWVSVRSVYSDTAGSEYTVDSNGSAMGIRIGDPNRTVTGVHAYRLTYQVRGSLNGFADHDELYGNAVGNRWDVPIGRASVRVSAPVAVTRAACFAGPSGSTAACQQAAMTAGVAHFSQDGLGPGEGLTVVVAIPKGVVASPGPVLRERWSLQRAFALTPVSAGVAGGLLAVLAVLGALVLVRGRDRRSSGPAAGIVDGAPVPAGEAVPLSGRGEPLMESAPPPGVRPGQAGTLLDGVANPRDARARSLTWRCAATCGSRMPRRTKRRRTTSPSGCGSRRTGGWSGSTRPAACWTTSRYCWMGCSRTPRRAQADHQRGCPSLGLASPGGSGWHKTRSIRMSPGEVGSRRAPTGSADGGCSSAPRCSSPERRRLSWQPPSATSR